MDASNQELELNEIMIWLRFNSKATQIFRFCFRSIILEKGLGTVQCSSASEEKKFGSVLYSAK